MIFTRVYSDKEEYLNDATIGEKYYINGARKLGVGHEGDFMCRTGGSYVAVNPDGGQETITYLGADYAAKTCQTSEFYFSAENEKIYMVKYSDVKDAIENPEDIGAYPSEIEYLSRFGEVYVAFTTYNGDLIPQTVASEIAETYFVDNLDNLILETDAESGYYCGYMNDEQYFHFRGTIFTTEKETVTAFDGNGDEFTAILFTSASGDVVYARSVRINDGEEIQLDKSYSIYSGDSLSSLSLLGSISYLDISRKYEEFISNYEPGVAVVIDSDEVYFNRVLPTVYKVRAYYDIDEEQVGFPIPICRANSMECVTERAIVDDHLMIWDATPEYHDYEFEGTEYVVDFGMSSAYTFDTPGEHYVDFYVNSKTLFPYSFLDLTRLGTNLKFVDVPEGIEALGDGALCVGTSLTGVTLPSTLRVVESGWYHQFGYDSLQYVNYRGTPSMWATKILFGGMVNNNPLRACYCDLYINGVKLTDMVIEGITEVTDSCFQGCSSITSLTVNNGVKKLNGGFISCVNLKTATLPRTIKPEAWFSNCMGLETVNLPDNLPEVSTWAFNNCRSLKDLVLPESAKSVGRYAFEKAFGDETGGSISLPGVEFIDREAFAKSNLTGVTFSDNLNEIGVSAFTKCTKLEEVTIPGSVGSNLGRYSFSWCSNLHKVVIEDGVTILPQMAFGFSNALYDLTIPNSIQKEYQEGYWFGGIHRQAFYPYNKENQGTQIFCISSMTFDAGDWLTAQTWASDTTILSALPVNNLAKITFGEHVTNIPKFSFSGLTKVKEVHCLGQNPPACTTTTGQRSVVFSNSGTLYVPTGRTSAYSSSSFKTCLGSNWTIVEEE